MDLERLKNAIDHNDINTVSNILSKLNSYEECIIHEISYYMIDKDNTEMIKLAIDHRLDIYNSSEKNKLSPIMYAISLSKINIIRQMLEWGIFPIFSYKLFSSVFKNNLLGIAEILVEYGFNINADDFGKTCLLNYNHDTNEDIVREFIFNGANANYISSHGYNLMTLVLLEFDEINNDNSSLIYYLIEIGCTIIGAEDHIFDCAYQNNKLADIINTLNRFGINFNIMQLIMDGKLSYPQHFGNNIRNTQIMLSYGIDINHKDKYGQTLLYIAARQIDLWIDVIRENHIDYIKFLLDNGANVNSKTDEGFTPLLNAITGSCDNSIISLLIENGANVKEIYRYNECILHHIKYDIYTDYIILLLENCSELINYQNDVGYTPLCTALKNTCVLSNYIKLLLDYGADINIMGNDNKPVIHHAGARVDLISLLLEYGADINAKCDNGETLIYGLVKYYSKFNKKALQFVLENGADVTIKYYNGNTLLHLLVKQYHDPVRINKAIRRILEYGADINAVNDNGETPLDVALANNDNGETPLDVALANNNNICIKYLIDNGAL